MLSWQSLSPESEPLPHDGLRLENVVDPFHGALHVAEQDVTMMCSSP
jgi:hypothetical protein